MKIKIGSKNINKVEAVREQIADYAIFANAEIESVDVDSGVSHQPVSFDEVMRGAMNRAKNAHQECDYSFGVESGLILVPYAKSNYMNICACAIYDGKNFHCGISSGFELPKKVVDLILKEGVELEEALVRTGVTKDERIGDNKGIVHFLTRGRLERKEFTREAIRMALVHLEHPGLYGQ